MRFIKKHWLEILLHILLWLAVLYVLVMLGSATTVVMNMKTINNSTIVMRRTERSLHPFMIFILVFLMLLFYSNVFWLFKKMVHWTKGFQQLGAVVAWFALMFWADYFIVGFLVDIKPSPTVEIKNFKLPPNIMSNAWLHMQLNILLIFLFTLGASIAYFFSKAWIANELIRKQLEAHQLSTEIKFLKSQINPHFLFNTLNNLFSMAQGNGNEELADGISRLSAMMRYMLYESNVERVPLRKEIEYLENCILLNRLRYADDEVNVSFDYPEFIDSLVIAPMLFVPFVENAFKYGVLVGQPWHIDMGVALVNKEVIFRCENKNYSYIHKMDDNNKGIGLENVKHRLQLLYPAKHRLTILSDEEKYVVELRINLE